MRHGAGPVALLLITVSGLSAADPGDPYIDSVVNAASFDSYPAIGWGSLITIFGHNLANEAIPAQTGPLPTKLGNTQVFAGNEALELLYVSPTQINARLSTARWDSAPWRLRVSVGPQQATTGNLWSFLFWPGIFTAGYDCPFGSPDTPCGLSESRGNGQVQRAMVTDQDYALVSNSNPARLGVPYTVWLTGLGNLGYDGDLRSKFTALRIALRRVPIEKDYQVAADANVLYANVTTFAGLYQINFTIPPSIVTNCGEQKMEVWIQVWANNNTSNVPSIPLQVSAAENPCPGP